MEILTPSYEILLWGTRHWVPVLLGQSIREATTAGAEYKIEQCRPSGVLKYVQLCSLNSCSYPKGFLPSELGV